MKVKNIFLASLALMLGWSGSAFAQNEIDALRYSRLGVSGTARVQGIGGAQSALGADVSSLSVNPAGLGMFRRSEFTFSPGIQYSNTQTDIDGMRVADDRNMLTIPQMGVVFSNRKGDEELGDWRGINFGISLTRLNNFNQQLSYRNTTAPPNTIVDYFAELAAGRTKADLDDEFGDFMTLEGLAYGNYLINFRDEFGNNVSDARPLYSLGDIDQQESIQRRGSQNQIDFGLGTSYKDKLYLGASVGIVSTKFTQESIFRESGYYVDTFDENGEPVVDGDYSLELRDEFTARGTGINLKVGVIARPVDALRLGASIQTPTAYTFTDDYQRSLYSTSVDPQTGQPANYSASELPGQFSYRLTTPFRATGGIAYFVGKYGFITADIEYVNYSNMRFSEEEDEFGTTGNSFSGTNSIISDTYKSVWNYKIGAEGRIEDFRLRAGYNVSTDPYRNAGFDGKVSSVTLGAGIRMQNYFVDAAYVHSKGNSSYSPYTFSEGGGEPVVGIEHKQNTVMFTVGYNF